MVLGAYQPPTLGAAALESKADVLKREIERLKVKIAGDFCSSRDREGLINSHRAAQDIALRRQ